ncbi:30S ribosomal protein S20 [Candidatus Babeliales bacterium]|nr:30S ribosomal protein S20 [Candidatus Babeliales bacterium]
MANIKSSKKRAKTNEIRRQRNIARRSDLKSATRKVTDALASGDVTAAQDLLKVAGSKIARAQSHGLLKKNTAMRRISNLAKKVAQAAR